MTTSDILAYTHHLKITTLLQLERKTYAVKIQQYIEENQCNCRHISCINTKKYIISCNLVFATNDYKVLLFIMNSYTGTKSVFRYFFFKCYSAALQVKPS